MRTSIRPWRIARAYGLLAAFWVTAGALFDALVVERSPQSEFFVEIAKGVTFVIATGAVLYLLLERVRTRLAASEASLDESRERSEAERRRIERVARIGHWVWRQDPGPYDWSGGKSEYSDSAAAIFGVKPADLAIGTSEYVERFVHPDDRLRMARKFSDPFHGESGPSLAEYRILRSDGAVRTIYEVTEMVHDPAGGPAYWQGTVQDVTDIRKTEANLAESEARFRDFAEVASQFQWELDANLRIVNYSGTPCELFPITGEEILGRTFRELDKVNAGIPESDWQAFEKLMAARQPFRDFPYTAEIAPGHFEYRRASARPIFDEKGDFQGWRGVTRDETKEADARKRATAAEELLRRAVENISDGFAIYDANDRLLMMNSKYRQSFPKSTPGDPTGRTFEELIRADVADGYYPEAVGREEEFIARRLSAHRRSGDLLIYKNSHGRRIQARDQILPDGSTVAIRTDVTEIAERDEALRQAQKMEALGQLTGGVAHDFNNLLMVAGGNLELLSEALGDDQQRLRRFANVALDAVIRGGQLTQRLLAFARRQNLSAEPTDLNKLIAGTVPLLHRTLGEQIAIDTVLATETWMTMTDGSQVENAVLNLAVNARDAMPQGGRLVIRTENLRLAQPWTFGDSDLPPGDYVLLSVSDNGQGMPPEVRDRAFEPFFTTKEAGRGTGLGLSMVYGFVKQSGGHVKILSEVGHGTTIQLFLPRVAAAAENISSGQAASLPGGQERVLLVEDEELVRSTVSTMLRSLGYDISEAADAKSALAIFAAKPAFDLVLTDMVMPGGMSGWDLAQAVWRDKPGQRFLFSTGHSDNPIVQQAHRDARIRVLPKPYSKQVLAVTLREAIDRPVSER